MKKTPPHTSVWSCGQGVCELFFCCLVAHLASAALELLLETFCSWPFSSKSLSCIVYSRHLLTYPNSSAAEASDVCESFHSSLYTLLLTPLFSSEMVLFFDHIETFRSSALSVWTFLPKSFCLDLFLPAAVPSPLSWSVTLRRHWWGIQLAASVPRQRNSLTWKQLPHDQRKKCLLTRSPDRVDKDGLLIVTEWHGRSETEHEAEQRRAKAKKWNQRRRAGLDRRCFLRVSLTVWSDVRQSSRSDDMTLRRLSRVLLKIVKDVMPLICCRNYRAKIQEATVNVTRRMNIFEEISEDSADMECEMNTRRQRSKDCASACRRVWGRWMKIERRLPKTLISTKTRTTSSNIAGFYHWLNWLFGLFSEILVSKDCSNERIQTQIDPAKLMTLKMCFQISDRHPGFLLTDFK